MAELAKDAFMSRNYILAAEMYERCLKERGCSFDLYFGYGSSLAKCGKLKEAMDVFSHCCRLQSCSGSVVSQDKLKHLVTALIDAVVANSSGPENTPSKCFSCPICEGILLQPVTTMCGHTFCRKCLSKESSRSCKLCGQKFASGKVLETNVLMKGLTEKWWPEEIRAARIREQGIELLQRNEVDAALVKFGEAALIAPDNHLTLSNRSQALLRLNQFHAALEDAESIVRLCPTWAKGHYHRGMALASLSRYEEALFSFLLCLALDHDMGAVQQEVTHALHRLLVGTPTGFRSRCHSLGLPAPYSLQGRRPRFLAASYPALNSSDCDDSSSGDEDFLQVPHRLSSSSLSSTVPQENTRLHALLDRIFQEIGKIRRTEMKPIDFPVNPMLVDQTDFDCVLCCRTLWQPVTTPCGHTYCWMCLDRCLDYSFACPLCMTSLADYLATSQKAVTEVIEHSLRLLLPAEYLARQVTHHQELSELAQLWGGQVPMFVCTTGFPGVPCPLYVYEPRYRVMMRHCAEAGSREFGIVACLTKDPGTKSYAEFGTMLEIRDWILLDNGCSILTTVGIRRFHVLSRGERDGYDTAKVEYFRDQPVPTDRLPELLELHERVRPKAWQWFDSLEAELQSEIVRAFGQMPGLEEDWPSLPDGPAWTWWLLAFLPLSQELKVEILATTSLEKRLRAIDKTLDRIQAAAVARQEQTMAVDSVEHQQNTNASHQPSLQHQNEDSTNSSRHVATASRDPPSHMFSGRFLGTNRERVRVVEPS